MRGTVVGSEGTQRLGFSPSLWKLVPGGISQVMEKEEGTWVRREGADVSPAWPDSRDPGQGYQPGRKKKGSS